MYLHIQIHNLAQLFCLFIIFNIKVLQVHFACLSIVSCLFLAIYHFLIAFDNKKNIVFRTFFLYMSSQWNK